MPDLTAVTLQSSFCLLLCVPARWCETKQREDEPASRSTSSAGEKSSWVVCLLLKPSVPTQPFVPHTVLALSAPLSLYPTYLFSHHSVLLSNITLCLCPLSASHPLQPLNFSTSPIHSIVFISSVVLSLSFLFTSFSSHLQGDTSVLKMGWPPLWYSKQSEDITRSKCALILCCHLCLLILSVPWTTLVFSPVFQCMGKRSTVK